MSNDRNDRTLGTDRTDRHDATDRTDARTEGEPRSENLGRRNFAGANYASTEDEQTRDLRRADPGPESNDADADSADIANDDMGE